MGAVIQQDRSRHRTAELEGRSGVGLSQTRFSCAVGLTEITEAACPDSMSTISLGPVPEAEDSDCCIMRDCSSGRAVALRTVPWKKL